MSAAHAILRILEQEGVEYIFGVPGGPLTGLFEAMKQRSRIRFVLAKHEAGAAYMAAAYARVTHSLAVCCATSGPGATNALTGIASAYADSLPVLLLTGQVASNVFGKGAIQESSVFGTDLVSLFRPVTKLSAMLPSVDRTPDVLRGALRTALSGRTGPVHINMPADVLRRPVNYVDLRTERYRSHSQPIDKDAIDRVARLLSEARHPCILAGHGVALARGSDALAQLARKANVPVATSPKGKGVFREDDELSLGVLGFGGHEHAEQYIAGGELDVLLVVGSTLNEFVTNAWTIPLKPTTAFIQIDIDPASIARNYPVDLSIVGDARATLSAMAESANTPSAELAHHRRAALATVRAHSPRHMEPQVDAQLPSAIKPQRVVRALREAMPDDAMLYVDNGTSIIWAGHYFDTRGADTYFIDLGLASMGSAVAGVVGGALAAPSRKAVALVGDGAFAMHGFEVHTAVEYGLPVVWVVLNNSGHGMVRQGDTLMHGASLGVSEFNVALDAAAMARGMGARGVRITDPKRLGTEIADALAATGPSVLDVVVDAGELAPTLVKRVQTLGRYLSLSRATDRPPSLAPPSLAPPSTR